jgi:hypothetical protein
VSTSTTFYRISDPFVPRYIRATVSPSIEDDWRLLCGEIRPELMHFRQRFAGSQAGDFIWTTSVSPVAVHERVLQAFEAAGITGWATYPVEVYTVKDDRLPGYHGLAITGRCGPLDRSMSTPVDPVVSQFGFQRWRGLHWLAETWDGSDLFLPEQASFKICTARVAQLLKRMKARNIRLEPTSDVAQTINMTREP